MDDAAKAKIKAVTDFAEAHRIGIHELFAIAGGRRPPPGDTADRFCVIDFGYRCVYTVEEQPDIGWCRHLSVSVTGDGYAPAPEAVLMLMAEFGFKGGFKDMLRVDAEPISDAKVAVFVIQQMEPKPEEKA